MATIEEYVREHWDDPVVCSTWRMYESNTDMSELDFWRALAENQRLVKESIGRSFDEHMRSRPAFEFTGLRRVL